MQKRTLRSEYICSSHALLGLVLKVYVLGGCGEAMRAQHQPRRDGGCSWFAPTLRLLSRVLLPVSEPLPAVLNT